MSNPIVDVDVDGETRKRLRLGEMDDGESVNLTLEKLSKVRTGDHGPYILAQVTDRDAGETHTLLVSSTYNAPGFVYEDEENTAFDEAMIEDLGEALTRDDFALTGDDGEEVNARGRSILDTFFEAPLNSDDTVLICFENKAKGSGRNYRTYWFGVPKESSGTIEWRDDDPEAEPTTATAE